MYWRVLVLFLFSCGTCATQLQIESSVVRVSNKANLAEIGQIKPGPNRDKTEFDKVKLPLRDIANRWLSAEQLAQQIKLATGKAVEVTGVERVWIDVCEPLNMELVRTAYERAFVTQVEYRQAKLASLALLNKDTCFSDPVKSAKLEPSNLFKPRQQIELVLENGKTTMAWLRVEAWLTVAKTNRSLPVNSEIRSADINWQSIKNTELRAGSKPLAEIGNRVHSRRKLALNTVLTNRNVYQKSLINKGEKVKVLLQQGALKVEATATALANGDKGEKVKVIFENSRKPVLANVIAQGVVGV